jgi:hypothetical protein
MRQQPSERNQSSIKASTIQAQALQAANEPQAICMDCGAISVNGTWRWDGHGHAQAQKVICDACQKIRDKHPDGYITIQGKFSREHGDEILGIIREVEVIQKRNDPLQRIMSIDKRAEKLFVAATHTHLVREIGKALRQVFQGNLEFNYYKTDRTLHALWRR